MMKAALLLSVLLSVPSIGKAQQDSIANGTGSVGPAQHTLSLSAGSNGMHVNVERADTDHAQDGDTLRITTAHKLIRIITTKRTDRDSIADLALRLKELRNERRRLFTYWAGLDLGINTFVAPDGRIGDGAESGPLQLNNGNSRFVAINFFEHKWEFGSNHFGLFTGLGIEWDNYRLSDNVTLQYDGDSTWAVPMDDPQLRKNKLRQTGLRVPLMFEFNTKRAPVPTTREEVAALDKSGGYSRAGNFHLAAGLVGSWFFDTLYKQKYYQGGEQVRHQMKAGYNLLPYRVAARVQVGYGALDLFAEYALTSMFQKDAAPTLSPLNVGLTLIGFN
jgi:hypothetical protein